jgi:hypothetical protein
MIIVSTTFAVTLVVLVAVASLTGITLLAAAAGRALVTHHRTRVARHESVRHYWGHLALGH